MLAAAAQIHVYSYASDIAAMALCCTLSVLIFTSQIKRSQRVMLLYSILGELFFAAVAHVVSEQQMLQIEPTHWVVYVFRIVHQVMLSCVLTSYLLYLYEPLWISHIVQRRNMVASCCFMVIGTGLDIIGTVRKWGFYIRDDGVIQHGFTPFAVVYILLVGQIFFFIIKYRSRLIRQVFWSMLGLNVISALLLLMQRHNSSQSYTTTAYLIPIIGLIFMFHSNPFDVTTGAASEVYFTNELEETISRGKEIALFVCRIRGFGEQMKESKAFRSEYYVFLRTNVKKGVLYHLSDDRLVLVLKQADAQPETMNKILSDFEAAYDKFRLDYKIVMMKSSPELTDAADYIRLLDEGEKRIPYNDTYCIAEDDIKQYYNSRYILSELEDIAKKNNLADPRVLVYCQPVYNIATGKYDTAEALMRLKLEKTGLVFPDQFIALAEEYNLIHTLSLIILDKTCSAIHDFIDEGYEFRRASVNFSTADLRYSQFTSEVKHIIDRNGIPYDCIAVEITESRSDADFNVLKEKVQALQTLGIKFYLDDFGTGYSNFERIMEIPFDIIKFDRSMLLEYSKDESSRYMVSTFAAMFHKLHYSVLFEGVENETDEQNCIEMNAKYLQGYKYSRPIPINELRRFLHRAAH